MATISCSQAGVGSEPEACFALTKPLNVTLAEDDTTKSDCISQLPSVSDQHQAAFAREYAEAYLDYLSRDDFLQLAETTRGDAALIFEAFAQRNLARGGKDEDKARTAELLSRAQSSNNSHAEAILRRSLGDFEFYGQEYEKAQPHYDEALALARSTEMAGFVPHILFGIGAITERMGDVPKSLDYNRQALLTPNVISRKGLKTACGNVAYAAQKVDIYSEEDLTRKISEANLSGEVTFAHCLTYGRLGRAIRRGDTEDTGAIAEQLLQEISGTPSDVIRARVLHAIGQDHYQHGNYVEALGLLEDSLSEFRETGDLVAQFTATNSIGNVFADMGDYDRALDTYQKSGELLAEANLGAPVSEATVATNIAWTYAMQGKHDEALVKYNEAYEIMEAHPKEALVGFLNYHYAKSLFEVGEVGGAIRMAKAAIPPTVERRNPLEAAAIYSWIASRQLELGDFADAEASLASANAIVSRDDVVRDSLTGDAGYRYWDADYHSNMATVLEKMGRPVEALGHSKRALELSFSRFETEQLEAAANAELKFDLWERDQTLALSQRDAELQALRLDRTTNMGFAALALAFIAALAAFFAYHAYRMQRKVAQLNTAILAEEHHRTKNALQMASSLTRQFERDAHTAKGDMRELRQRLKTMALLHEHLRSASGAIEVDACSFISELADQVCEGMAPSGVSIETHCKGVSLAPGVATSLSLMLCEMMINACKHAFPHLEEGSDQSEQPLPEMSEGLILVRLELEGNFATARVIDNGIGDAIPPTYDFGTGTQLIEDLSAQIGAVTDFEQSSEGSCWIIHNIPASKSSSTKTVESASA